MKPVDQFLYSVRDVFARNRTVDWAGIGLLVLASVSVGLAAVIWLRWRRTRRETARQVEAVAARAGIGRDELDYLAAIARAVGLEPLLVMTRLAAFERATAVALATKSPPPLRPGDGSGYERVRHLRKALGFSPLPPHHWLVSTRELVSGDPVSAGGLGGRVVEVNEASFAVEMPAAAPFAQDGLASLAIARADDSRYVARVRVLATEDGAAEPAVGETTAGLRRIYFAHDERPSRQQDREYVRVRATVKVTLHVEHAVRDDGPAPLGASPSTNDTLRAGKETVKVKSVVAVMVDVSAGGLAVNVRLPDPEGGETSVGERVNWKTAHVRCSFQLGDGRPFENLAVVVAGADAVRGVRNAQHLRLAFTGLPPTERDRLSAAVAAQRRPSPVDDEGAA